MKDPNSFEQQFRYVINMSPKITDETMEREYHYGYCDKKKIKIEEIKIIPHLLHQGLIKVFDDSETKLYLRRLRNKTGYIRDNPEIDSGKYVYVYIVTAN